MALLGKTVLEKQSDENKNVFIAELLNNLENIKDNILYDDLIKTESND